MPKTAVVEVVEVVEVVVEEEPPSSLPQETMVRLKRNTKKMCKILSIFSSIPKVKYYLHILLDYLITQIGLFYKNVGRLLGGCPTCEVEIVWK